LVKPKHTPPTRERERDRRNWIRCSLTKLRRSSFRPSASPPLRSAFFNFPVLIHNCPVFAVLPPSVALCLLSVPIHHHSSFRAASTVLSADLRAAVLLNYSQSITLIQSRRCCWSFLPANRLQHHLQPIHLISCCSAASD
ncbi:hypothetical protein PIB30_056479, partial [Stylosanthes scabra]|nr:hypothetical protein [Stylosanthes scabra]